MASTRASSPTSDAGSPSSPQLSPNSKIKAMLAALDNDSDTSDKESVSGSARSRLMKSINKSKQLNSGVDAADKGPNQVDTVDSSSEDEEISLPRGRVAAAMRAQARPNVVDEDSGSELVQRPGPAKRRSPIPSSGSDAASDDSDVPVVSRKRKVRTDHRSTPEQDAQSHPTSPGLFVSPTKSGTPSGNASESDDLPEAGDGDARFKALVERKRKEVEAREKAAEAFRAKVAAEKRKQKEMLGEDELSISDGEGGRRLTQQAKPTRKASKKALEEMHRETQRLSRNQQLAHYATTKKKFATIDFLKRFNPQAERIAEESSRPAAAVQEPTSSSPMAQSDVEMQETPPTSPASAPDDSKALPALSNLDGNDLTTLEITSTQVTSPISSKDKGKEKAIKEASPGVKKREAPVFKHRLIRVRPAKLEDRRVSPIDDSDSDLEIVAATKHDQLKAKLDAAFSKAPIKKPVGDQSLYTLRMLAHLKSPGKQNNGRNKKPSMTTTELAVSLHQKARQQAAQVKEERLEDLRKRGIVIQSTEERQKEMAEIEDLISKARREAEELSKKEKEAAKQARKEAGEVDPQGDSSDDEDWEEEKDPAPASGPEEEVDESETGSDGDVSGEEEEEEDEEDMEADGEAEDPIANPMLDNEASETDDDEAEAVVDLSGAEDIIDDGGIDEEEDEMPTLPQTRRARKTNVISDDEDELPIQQTPSMARKITSPAQLNTDSPVAPTSVLRSATKTFIPGLTVTGPVGLGLTQIFAGTMDDSQMLPSQSQSATQEDESSKNDQLAFLRRIPAPSLPPFAPTLEEEETQAFPESQSQVEKIPESQPIDTETQGLQLSFTQSQVGGFDSFMDDSQMSPFPEATQDLGFVHRTPIKGRFADIPPSTVDTMVMDPSALPETLEETPVVKRKGKLRRRAPQVFSDDEDVAESVNVGDDLEISESVFDVLRKASKKKVVVDDFDKKNSKAKEMVQEQADESEDEYAGLGGASDDESDGQADEYVKAMIDDEGSQNVDKAKIAAFFADRERANDEKAIEKLYKDITSGMLRRKRGADYDLSDSDDGGEARRRMKRKEFAKMRKALLADERIGKIAENPKRQAFLRAIEDRGSEDEMDFLNDGPEQEEDSQSQSQADSQQAIPNSQPGDMGPPKRKRSDDSQEEARLPPHLRRTRPGKKPSNLSEFRESLSSLIEEPNSFAAPVDAGSESEDNLEIEGEDELGLPEEKVQEKENRDPFALRRKRSSIIDRISLKRENSSNVSNSTRLAFATSSNAPGFKVPALLRRATTNSLSSTTSSTSATERSAGGGEKDGVKRGGGKNSGVNYFARETERRAAIQKTEARRDRKRIKGAEVRRKVVGGLLGSGKFE